MGIVDEDTAAAQDVLTDAFPTPCQQEEPKDTTIAENHVAACHRYDEDAPGEREKI